MNKTAQDALRAAALAAIEPNELPRELGDRGPIKRELILNIIEDLEERMLIAEQSMLTNRIDKNLLAEERNKGKHSAYQASMYMLRNLLSAPAIAEHCGRIEAETKEEQR